MFYFKLFYVDLNLLLWIQMLSLSLPVSFSISQFSYFQLWAFLFSLKVVCLGVLLCGTLCSVDLGDSCSTLGGFSASIGLDPQDHSFQGMSDGAHLEASAGFLEDRPGARPWRAELGLGPLSCSHVQGLSRDG